MKDLARLRQRLPRLKRWVTLALLAVLVLASYYGIQGWRHYTADQDLQASKAKIREFDKATAGELPAIETLESEGETRKRQLEEWAGVFSLGGFTLTVDDESGTVRATVKDLGALTDAVTSIDLEITPGAEYGFTVQSTGSARHYKLVPQHPELVLSATVVRYQTGQEQEWGIKAAPDETVVLEFGTHSPPENRGAPQADFIGVTVFDQASGSAVLGPTSTALILGTSARFTFSNTSTPTDLRVRVTPNGHFFMRKVGGDERLYLRPCPGEGEAKPEPEASSCAIGVFEEDSTHDWTLRWATSTPPLAGEARLLLVAPSSVSIDNIARADTDHLLHVVSATALKSGVGLKSISVMEGETADFGKLTFQAQTLAISLYGQTHSDFFAFLSRLHSRMPFVGVKDFSMAGFGAEPTANLVVTFYLAPERASQEAAE